VNKILRILLKNNIIIILIHMSISVVLLYPFGFMMHRHADKPPVLSLMICLVVIFVLYILAVGLFIRKSNDIKTRFFSVIPLTVIIMTIIPIAYGKFFELCVLFLVPTAPFSETISYLLQIDGKYGHLIMSPLPSLALWIGMIVNLDLRKLWASKS